MTTQTSPFGMKGIIQVFKETRWKTDLLWSLGVAIPLSILLAYIWEFEWLKLLAEAVGALLSIYGGLLGVSIATYALLISMPHLRKLMHRVKEDQKASLYAKIHAQFTVYLLLQIFTLLGAFIVSMIVGAPRSPTTTYPLVDQAMSALILFALLSSFIYQMLLIKDSIVIIYNGAILDEIMSEKFENT
nr:MAG TPA: hypothetical protein [Caudoviricetes sp.]